MQKRPSVFNGGAAAYSVWASEVAGVGFRLLGFPSTNGPASFS